MDSEVPAPVVRMIFGSLSLSLQLQALLLNLIKASIPEGDERLEELRETAKACRDLAHQSDWTSKKVDPEEVLQFAEKADEIASTIGHKPRMPIVLDYDSACRLHRKIKAITTHYKAAVQAAPDPKGQDA